MGLREERCRCTRARRDVWQTSKLSPAWRSSRATGSSARQLGHRAFTCQWREKAYHVGERLMASLSACLDSWKAEDN
jgi:hypothetical protein